MNLRPLGYENSPKVASSGKESDKTRLDPAFESSIFAFCSRQIARLSFDRQVEGWSLTPGQTHLALEAGQRVGIRCDRLTVRPPPEKARMVFE